MTLDPDAARILEAIRETGRPGYETMTVAEAREAYRVARAATTPELREVAQVVDLSAPGPGGAIPMRLYRPIGPESKLPALVYMHGGGWVLGNLDSHDSICRHLAAEAGCIVVSVDYRLAPEHKFPAAVDDALAATRWVRAEASRLGVDPSRIAVGGDSAGGTLATVVSLMMRDAGDPPLRFQLLIYPVTDLSMDTPSHSELAEGYLLTRNSLLWFQECYLRSPKDRTDWRAAPMKAENLSGAPPTFILTAGYDPLRDEAEAYAARLIAAGNRVTAWRIPGQIHGFLPMGKVMSGADAILDEIAKHLALALS